MSVFRRSWPTERKIKPGLRRRIFIPSTPERPFIIPSGDVIRKDVFAKDKYWFTIHRRGISRPEVGVDPLEARAVPETQVRGYLHERVLYRYFVEKMRFMPGVDFTFQSSFEGGRSELGGMVADFLFFNWRMVINVKGPTHYLFLQSKKDEEQEGILAEMGFTVFYPDLRTIESEFLLEDWARRVFNYATSRGAGSKADTSASDSMSQLDATMMDNISQELASVGMILDISIAAMGS